MGTLKYPYHRIRQGAIDRGLSATVARATAMAWTVLMAVVVVVGIGAAIWVMAARQGNDRASSVVGILALGMSLLLGLSVFGVGERGDGMVLTFVFAVMIVVGGALIAWAFEMAVLPAVMVTVGLTAIFFAAGRRERS